MSPEFVGPTTNWEGKWEYNKNLLGLRPLQAAIPLAIELALASPDLETALRSLSSDVDDGHIETAKQTLKRYLKRDSDIRIPGDLRLITPRIQIVRYGYRPVETRVLGYPADANINSGQGEDGSNFVIVGKRPISVMEFDADCGRLGRINGRMFGWSSVKATWEQAEGKAGYIEVNPKYGLVREIGKESIARLRQEHGIFLDQPDLVNWARGAWESASVPDLV